MNDRMAASLLRKRSALSDGKDGLILSALGERRILTNVIIPRLALQKVGADAIGDDCAEFPTPPLGHSLLVTTDPCPLPIAFDLGDRDYWHYGWFTILINVSDLAAMGATPSGIVVSAVMPEDMQVADFRRYLDGLVDAADEWDCPILGGNIKDGPGFTSTATAFGAAPTQSIMRRTGAQAGDKVCVVGNMGLFWAAVLSQTSSAELAVSGSTRRTLEQALLRPVARLREGRILARSGLVTACMDASDGVGGCLSELAVKNGLDVVIDQDALVADEAVVEVASALFIDPRKLMLSWGNWELVLTVNPWAAETLLQLADEHRFPVSIIGTMKAGAGSVLLSTGNGLRQLTNFASERFTGTSYFTHGLRSYMQWLLDAPLFEHEER